MLESTFKTKIKNEIEEMLPGCIVVHLDPTEIQGIPDMLVLYENKWAALEGKQTINASHRPNQDYYVELMDHMSFATFVYPENKDRVLKELYNYFRG